MYRTKRIPRRERRVAAALVAVLGLAPVAAGCSSSSSGGDGTSDGETPASAPSLSPLPGVTAAGVYGPNGVITKPTYNPPESTSPGGSTVFPHVTNARYRAMVDPLNAMAGVQHVTYYPQFSQIQVYFDKGATSTQRQAVYRYVTSKDPAATG
jgi:hypothetical protein